MCTDSSAPGVMPRIIVVSSSSWVHSPTWGNISGIEVSCSTMWFTKHSPAGVMSGPVQDHKGVWHICWSMHSSCKELFKLTSLVGAAEVVANFPPILGAADILDVLTGSATGAGRLVIGDVPAHMLPEPHGSSGHVPVPAHMHEADSVAEPHGSFGHVPVPALDAEQEELLHLLDSQRWPLPSHMAPLPVPALDSGPARMRRLLRGHSTATIEIERDSECSTTEAEFDDDASLFESLAKRARR